jgi:hypothetical protein
MNSRRLSPPVTTDQEYAAAILDEIRGLRADLRDGAQPLNTARAGEVRITEPEPARGNPPLMVDMAADPDVDDFHTGGGWYQLPGHTDKIRGRDNALRALREG